jgi:hypothetical protein
MEKHNQRQRPGSIRNKGESAVRELFGLVEGIDYYTVRPIGAVA